MDAQDHYNRAARFRAAGEFYSRRIPWTARWPKLGKLLVYCVDFVWQHGHDDLKAPMGNDAKPAFTSPAATNFYYGANVKLLEDGTLLRYSYGMGSGAYTTGLYQETMLINPFFPELAELMSYVQQAMSVADPLYADMLEKYPFNVVSVKVYYWYLETNEGADDDELKKKTLGWHSDVVYNKGVADPMNSQVPGTPVGLLAYGAKKKLHFHKGPDAKTPIKDTEITMKQSSGTLIALDPRDEEQVKRKNEELYDQWYHSSEAGEDEEGVTYVFCFRSCQMVRRVTPLGRLVEPRVGAEKRFKFENAARKFETDKYEVSRMEIEGRMVHLHHTEEEPWRHCNSD